MSFKTIAVHLDDGPRCAIRITRKARSAPVLSFGVVGAAISKPTTPDTRKRPKELMGTSVRRVLRLRINPQSLVAAWFLARLPCGRRTWFQGPSRGSLLEPVWRFNLPLRARRNVRWGPWSPQQACPRTCSKVPESYPRT